ncbi:retrovirus-related Pol polyprotein from transposon 412 [Trichonephila clavipes]|nr:retrovirus-related Pol polyprotein from transposon 412 [Trichonephila clavipes]
MRYIGQGLSSLETFCSLMCLPNPVSQKAYDKINAKIADISEALANASMKKNAAEEKIIDRTVNSVVVNSDGTWKTRGHTSHIGVCALIGADCGKVLDMEVMSSYCKGCDSDKGPKLGPKYSAFLAKHLIFCRKTIADLLENGSLRNAENFSPIRTKTWIKVSAIHSFGVRKRVRESKVQRGRRRINQCGLFKKEQNMKLNQIASEERSGLSSAQSENTVLSALADRLEEINLRVGRLQEASAVTARLDSKIRSRLFQLLISHKSAFARSTVELSAAATEHHRISLQHDYPIKCPIYKIPFNLRNEFRRQITDLEKAGIISKSNFQYNTPALFVKQKEKWRLVLDFRKLNEITLTQDFVIPTLDDILHEISGSNYFSALDMKSAFNQIPLHFADRHKTAFSTPDGFVVTPEGILIDKDKSVSINEFPVPKDQKQIKSFLGCCNFYRRYIKNFAKSALPLTNLLRKDTPFEWTSETQEAFDDIKKAILNPPVLALPDQSAELQITTDASSRGIGAVLEQKYPNSEVKPLYFFSKKLNPSQSKYNATVLEFFVIYTALNFFRPFLLGRKFKVFTDHKPLAGFLSNKNPSSKILRWKLALEEFNYDIHYIRGSLNSVADHLSRYINNITIALPDSKDLINMQRENSVLSTIIQKIDQNDVSPQISNYFINGEGLLCHLSKRPSRSPRSNTTRKQVCIPHCLKAKILESVHSEYGGHLKFFKTYHRLSENFFWHNMYKDTKNFVRSCTICLSRKRF